METPLNCNGGSLEDLDYSGYDLLDKLSRRRQYVRSHVREKTCIMASEPVQSYSDSDIDELKISGLGLMEKSSLDTRKSRNMSWYDDTRTTFRHNADYLKRLSSLRDNLIDQEQTNFTQAIERLKAKQANREILSKQKARQAFEHSDGNTKKLITTFDRFQQSRPKHFRPELPLPLEGKQILEPQISRTPQLSEKSGSAASYTRSSDDSVIRNNLQRLIAPITPTSSIPNIGRKSQKCVQQLVLDTSPLQRKKTCLSAEHTDKNPFKHVHKGARVRKIVRPDLDELDLSPQAVKFEKMSDHDKLNMDKLKEFYCIYYLPSNTPTGEEEIQPDDYESNCGSSINENKSQTADSDKHGDRDSKSADSNETRKFPSDEYRYKAGYFGASQRVPERKPMIHPITGKALVTNSEDIRKHRLRKLHLSSGINNPEIDSHLTHDANSRKQIIVDMPSIVFNAPTPEVTEVELRAALLAKAYKQNELRQRELKNLLDDVKELNIRSEALAEHLPLQRPPI